MKLSEYITTASRPLPYTPGTAFMWDDEHISKQLLAIHLNPDTDLASRKPTTVLSTIDWLENGYLHPGSAILDLGCGPGLYTEHLARRGHRVTGVDISANSIQYAQESAKRHGLNIIYHNMDYLNLDGSEAFDLILMIFTDFGVLVPEARKKVLTSIYRALKPGGVFCFDFLNSAFPIAETGDRNWEIGDGGFWREGPYLHLQEKHYYPEQNVCLSQHVVMDDKGETDIYRFWTHTFKHEQMLRLIRGHGFSDCGFHEGILPDSELYHSHQVTFCFAGK